MLLSLLEERVAILKENGEREKGEEKGGREREMVGKQEGYVGRVRVLVDEGGDSVEDFLCALYSVNSESASLFLAYIEGENGI